MRKHNPKLTPRAKELRKGMTPQEKRLWYNYLNQLPIRFLRQKIICNYIVDFYCAKLKLAIEIDGTQHFTQDAIQYDIQRTHILNTYDIEVIRFNNHEVDNNFYSVCGKIDYIIKKRGNNLASLEKGRGTACGGGIK
ncbi:endonuclease domain-containing protein [Paludicola sp. MB14-C6]|uniref:endonuclease domain-containing protein n=1 Tax=Paludihabitans sp. MB14-C6 TaxID=3070656 RepID=UPI0027DD29AD|nr:endonuclease domain-containing protein [Paludicola sp. MB14-C6]WMJ22071.1 endonuclease domain-containing protein [Paludicola sp. MB14-C6]